MDKLIITGCGTDVGKTVISAIVATALNGEYWKPIECGGSDTSVIQSLTSQPVHPPAYVFKAPLSPHAAARLENREIDIARIRPPQTIRPLIIETAGGVLVPLNEKTLALDLFDSWNAAWIIVSRSYLGSINHTLLTLEALRKQNVRGIIFNGGPNPIIQQFSKVPCLGILPEVPTINKTLIEKYAQLWKPKLL